MIACPEHSRRADFRSRSAARNAEALPAQRQGVVKDGGPPDRLRATGSLLRPSCRGCIAMATQRLLRAGRATGHPPVPGTGDSGPVRSTGREARKGAPIGERVRPRDQCGYHTCILCVLPALPRLRRASCGLAKASRWDCGPMEKCETKPIRPARVHWVSPEVTGYYGRPGGRGGEYCPGKRTQFQHQGSGAWDQGPVRGAGGGANCGRGTAHGPPGFQHLHPLRSLRRCGTMKICETKPIPGGD